MMGHAPFLTKHLGRTAKKEVHQQGRGDHDARAFICGVASAFAGALASNALSIAARFRAIERTIERAILTAKRSQKAIPSAKMAKTAINSTLLSSGKMISEYMLYSSPSEGVRVAARGCEILFGYHNENLSRFSVCCLTGGNQQRLIGLGRSAQPKRRKRCLVHHGDLHVLAFTLVVTGESLLWTRPKKPHEPTHV
jgi:hypothetical protein